MQAKNLKLVGKIIAISLALLMLPAYAVTAAVDNAEPLVIVEIQTLTPEDRALAMAAGTVRYDYGSFMTVEMTQSTAIAVADSLEVDFRPDRDIVQVHEWYSIDTKGIQQWIDPEFKINSYASGVRGPYLVQFTGPTDAGFRTAISNLGAEVTQDWGAGYAVTARMTPAQADRVERLPFVNSVSVFQPHFKVDPQIWSQSTVLRLDINLFPSVDQQVFIQELIDNGANLMDSYWSPTFSSLRITIDESQLPYLANDNRVETLWQWDPVTTQNNVASTLVHFVRDAWDGNRNGLGVALDGNNVVVGIQDSGFDMGNSGAGNQGHPDFFGGCGGDRVIRFQARTTSAQQPDGNIGSQPVAHGTHVAGSVMANGFAWSQWYGFTPDDCTFERDSFAGQAPRAQLSFDGVTTSTGGIASSTSYWVTEIGNGARILSNSWGCSPCSSYGGTSSWVDDRIANTNADLIVLFAAGNDGPGSCKTDNQNGGAKNGLMVAAGQNFRPEWFDSDNPGLVADFSSRGGTGCVGGRYKPDITGVGTSVQSVFGYGEWLRNVALGNSVPINGWSDIDVYDFADPFPAGSVAGDGMADYQLMQGTSMACPTTAGGQAIIEQYFKDVEGLGTVPNALRRASMINGAMRMNPIQDYPGYAQGWGRWNVANSLFPEAPRSNQMFEGSLSGTGTTDAATLTQIDGVTAANFNVVSSGAPLKITLVWVDTSGSSINRNLNLRVVDPLGVEYRGNNYVSGEGFSQPGCGGCTYDTVNNVEQVEVESPFTGVWTVEIIRASMPSAAPYALIFSADVGPTDNYDVVIDTDPKVPKFFNIVPDGSHTFPFTVTNYGSSFDNITLSVTNIDPAITASFPSGATLALPPYDPATGVGRVSTYLQLDAAAGTPLGEDPFELVATSLDDLVPPTASDTVDLNVQVLNSPLPPLVRIAGNTADETDPSVVVFTDGFQEHIVVGYRNATVDGVHTFTVHGTLDSGTGAVTWDASEVDVTGDGLTGDFPNDIRLIFIPTMDRVLMTWTGCDPGEANADLCSWSRSSYTTGASTYSTWTSPVTIQKNIGTDVQNSARVGFALDLDASASEIIYVWEHLDSPGGGAELTGVDTNYRVSTNGGGSWSGGGIVTPGDGNYYFFPNGCTDQNNVGWIFFYWRTPTGNDRDLRVRLYDGALQTGSGGTSDVWNTADNVQFPACTSTAEGASANRIYFAVTRDQAVDLKMYTDYIDGDFTGVSPPADSSNGWDSPGGPDGPFGTVVSDANYNRRPILNIAGTDDGYVWLPYIENSNIYNAPNLHTFYSNDGFTSVVSETIVTKDSFAKGHQMAASITMGAFSYMYEVFHMSLGVGIEVDYDIYMVIYREGWETAPDTTGPIAENVAMSPTEIPTSSTATLSAVLDDITTGFNDIQAAQYRILNETMVEVVALTAMAAVSTFNSPNEGADATVDPLSQSLGVGSYWVCVVGQDSLNNWGTETCSPFEVISGGQASPIADGSRTSPISGPAPLVVSLDATASSDPNGYGDISVFEWTIDDRIAGSLTTTTRSGDLTSYVFDDPGTWDVSLRLVDSTSRMDWYNFTVTVSAYPIPVTSGIWNLVSLPMDWAEYDILAGAGNRDLLSIVSQDGAGGSDMGAGLLGAATYRNGAWESFVAARPSYMNTLDKIQLDSSYALWLDLEFIAGFDNEWNIDVYRGYSTQSQAVQFGWNLVPYLELLSCTAHDGGLADVDNAAKTIAAYPFVQDIGLGAEPFQAGQSYWIHSNGAGIVDLGLGC